MTSSSTTIFWALILLLLHQCLSVPTPNSVISTTLGLPAKSDSISSLSFPDTAQDQEDPDSAFDPSLESSPPITIEQWGSIITECSVPGTVSMTFDDGPFIYTNELLDILEEHEVRATFFINGDSAGQIGDYTEAVQRAFDAGHQIASHTWHHVDLATQTNIEIEYQMSHLDEVLKDIIGVRPRYMRPPYGSLSENARKKLINMGYEIVSWSVDTNDWRHPTNVWESMKAYRMAVLQRHRGQFIVLQHETIMNTVRKLVPAAIKMLKAKGFQIVPVGACLGVEPDDWYRE